MTDGRLSSIRLALVFAWGALAAAQSTQGLVTGHVVDSENGRPVGGARVAWTNQETGMSGASTTGTDGIYDVLALSPGSYRLTVSAAAYQAQDIQNMVLAVAARLELDFRLRPLHDVWEQGSYRSVFLPGSRTVLNFFGPDVDSIQSSTVEGERGIAGALESTVSFVIDPVLIRDLPFAGRNIYAALTLIPGATSDGGTALGLGLSVNGQRPSSSNYLLDGLEANNYLLSGPLLPIAPEAVQEYRVSTNNYSAQYGGTTGFIANAVTRAGGDQFHGNVYSFVQNAILNANDFQRNLSRWGRPSGKVAELGFQIGGPVLKRKAIFFSSSFDRYGSRTEKTAVDYKLLTGSFADSLSSSSLAYQLLAKYPSPASTLTGSSTVTLRLAAPVEIDRNLGLERLDYRTDDGRHRLSARIALARSSQPDFVWTPYQGLNSRLSQDTSSGALTHFFNVSDRLLNEAKASFNLDDLHWNRGPSDIPWLVSFDGTVLPGNPALYSYKNVTKFWQFEDNLTWAHGRHIVTAGGGLLWRWLNGYMTPGESGEVDFQSTAAFASDSPLLYRASRSFTGLESGTITPESYDRSYRLREFSLFVQDTFRVSSHLVLNYGLRYENFGNPFNTGPTQDPRILLGTGSSLLQRLQTASLVVPQNSNDPVYTSNQNNWEPRLGMSYDLSGRGKTILRASFGLFHDRLFDNLWQTTRLNNLASVTWFPLPQGINYLNLGSAVLAPLRNSATDPTVTAFDPNLPTAESRNYFGGVQHRFSASMALEVNVLGASGRNLLATDVVNRSPGPPAFQIVTTNLPFNIQYREAAGYSDYHALTAAFSYRATYSEFHLAYTWSHSIDNQSDPLQSGQFNLAGTLNGLPVAFAQQFDPASDRGNSDFDQRQNLVFYSVWNSPSMLQGSRMRSLWRDWRFSQLAAFRTGFPFSVYGAGGARVDILDPNQTTVPAQSVPGGIQVLNPLDFVSAVSGSGRNSGRNAFRGPGLFNVDFSLSRTFGLRFLGESGRFVLRADAFNVFNHTNLGNPNNALGNPAFGISSYGRMGFDPGFPAATPLLESPRQVQLSIAVRF